MVRHDTVSQMTYFAIELPFSKKRAFLKAFTFSTVSFLLYLRFFPFVKRLSFFRLATLGAVAFTALCLQTFLLINWKSVDAWKHRSGRLWLHMLPFKVTLSISFAYLTLLHLVSNEPIFRKHLISQPQNHDFSVERPSGCFLDSNLGAARVNPFPNHRKCLSMQRRLPSHCTVCRYRSSQHLSRCLVQLSVADVLDQSIGLGIDPSGYKCDCVWRVLVTKFASNSQSMVGIDF